MQGRHVAYGVRGELHGVWRGEGGSGAQEEARESRCGFNDAYALDIWGCIQPVNSHVPSSKLAIGRKLAARGDVHPVKRGGHEPSE